MKKLKYLCILSISLASLISCNKEEEPLTSSLHQVTFSFSDVSNEKANGRLTNSSTPDKVRVTIINDQDEAVQNEVLLDLIGFGSSYVSTSLMMQKGNYQLVLFQILDDESNVIYASPLAGSEKAILVNKPLPIAFQVGGEMITTIIPEVLPVTVEDTPADFGYAQLAFQVVNNFAFDLAVYSDEDSLLVESQWVLLGYNQDSVGVTEQIKSYSATDPTLILDANMAFYEIRSADVNSATYHPVSHYFTTEYLKSIHTLSLSFATLASNNVVRIAHESFGLNEISIYYPMDLCQDNFRVDMTGLLSSLEVDEQLYFSIDHSVLDESSVPYLPSAFYESFERKSNLIWHARSEFAEPANFCETISVGSDDSILFIQANLIIAVLDVYGIFSLAGNTQDQLWESTIGF
jgi:hypothetical protein